MSETQVLRRVTVEVDPPYEVLVGSGLLKDLPALVSARQVAIVCDENVATLHAARLPEAFALQGAQCELLIVEPGEASKSIATWAALLEQLAAAAFTRDCVVVGLGGGVVTDLAGFVAASYLRGVAYVSAPTSLLGMVDAGVGGKTGLNLRAGKNLAGAFWQPRFVAVDVDTLASLPERQFRHGSVEFFKHALIGLPEQLKLLAAGGLDRAAPRERLADWLADNIAVKATVVAQDEHESGVRTHLNYGHTLAHALEGASEHQLEHGEAVAYGILFAALLGRARGLADVVPVAMQLLGVVQPGPLGPLALEDLLPYMARDKKNRAGVQRFVLLARPGQPIVVDDVSAAELEGAWLELRNLVEGLAWEAMN